MIPAVGTLIEAELSLESEGGILVDTVEGLCCRKDCYSLVYVLEHVGHDDLAGVTWSVKLSGITVESLSDPRNVPESLHLLEIEEGAEELGESGIFSPDFLVLALVDVSEQLVDSSEHGP